MSNITYFGKVSEHMINSVNGKSKENFVSKQRPFSLTPEDFKAYLMDNKVVDYSIIPA